MSHELTDTRITAYIFAELSPEQTAAFERELANSTELQEELAAIRETLGALESEFEARSAGIGDSQRQAIEEAIHSRSSTDKVGLNDSTNETSRRRLVVMAVMAASLLIVVGLAYPYLQNQTGTPVSMNDPASVAATESGAEADEQVAEFVEIFNSFINEERYEEAEVLSKQVAQLKPGDPIADSMSRTSQMGKRLAKAEEERSKKELNFTDHTEDQLEGTTVQLPNFSYVKPGEISAETSPNRSKSPAQTPEVLEESLEAARELNELDDSGIANRSNSKRRFDAEYDLTMMEDGDDVFGRAALDSGQQKAPRRSRRSMGSMEEMMGGMEMEAEIVDLAEDRLAVLTPGKREAEELDVSEMQMGGFAGMEMGMGGMGGGMMGTGMPQGDKFEPIEDNPFVNVHDSPLSTFSIDVDTASYAKVRSLLNQNSLPRPDAVRIEEFLNYFNYDYAPPEDDHPFAASMEIAACPWNPTHRLARIGIKGKVIEADRPSSNLVFLLDVSGSMDEPNKLPLVIKGTKMLTDQLTENDKVAIVVYAGAAGMVLDATRGDKKQQIVAALDRLKAGGSTNGGQGIMLAYQLARDNFIVGGTNRVILCSDGDFNVGVTGTDQLVSIAQENAKSNIFLSVLGFGIGNHNDAMMEQISNKGNGNYAFIDSKSEAKKVLVEELGATLVTIAKDVKIQIEFNPQEVASYRLIGYENRMLEAQDFNDDKKDAGEIGAGHTVTALYEIVPAKVDDVDMPAVDNLRYQKQIKLSKEAASGEMLVLKLRYKQPEGNTSTLIKFPVTDTGKKFSETDRDFQFAASVAGFGMLLRNSPHKGNATFAGVARIAREGAKGDETGYRIEFLELVTKAKQLRGE